MKKLTIATRGSKLALWQANHVAERLRSAQPDLAPIELLVLKTRGDKILDVPLAKIGGKGLFIKEIEEALLDGRADLAVHSMKDVPMDLPDGLILGAILERETPLDAFLSCRWAQFAALPQGARVGTSSLRRQAQMLALRPDLTIIPLRGNVDTRLAKLLAGEFDAIIMAAAGLNRLGLAAPLGHELPPEVMLPAAGQGALGVECRSNRSDLIPLLAGLDHTPTRLAVSAERGLLAGLDGGCQTPIAAHAALKEGELLLTALLMDLTGTRAVRGGVEIPLNTTAENAYQTGRKLAATFRASGGDALLAELLAIPL